jgi:glycosyltransferase involved in cell wall biosynthesis
VSAAAETPPLPPVSVIMTALNEERHLADAVASVFEQDYPGPLELVVAVGPSRDRTRSIAESLAAAHRHMRVVDNPSGRTPAGLNLAIAAIDPASTVVVRTDGHAQLPPGYVREAVEVLLRTGAANVGGRMIPEGVTPFEQAVARAMSEPIGLGSAPFHVGGEEGPADSVYLGVFRRSILAETGGFDEYFARAQDWELNHRIRRLGGVVWFDPALEVRYRPRSDLRRLATQFRGSGAWRWQVVRVHPSTVNLRYLAAPAATAALACSAAVLVLDALVLRSAALAALAALPPAGYVGLVLGGSALTGRGLDAEARRWYPVVLATIHLSWGTGFLLAAADDLTRERRRRVAEWWHKQETAQATVTKVRALLGAVGGTGRP